MEWDRGKYRKEIIEMKEQIPDREMFLSERYQELLRKMAVQITKSRFTNVHTYADQQDGLAGWCNGKKIGINIANKVTQSFPVKELKNKSLIGYLGHECGHQNYSAFSLREKYLRGIKEERRLYPKPPEAENEEEAQALKEIHKAFQTGQPYVLSVFYSVAAYLQNFLEDLYIEEKMCRKYPGSIRQGILQNRKRWTELSQSVKAKKDNENMETVIMTDLLVQFALEGNINVWDGVAEDYLRCLESSKPYLERVVYEDGESYRFQAANQILLKLWKFIKKDAQALEAKQDKKKQDEEKQEEKQKQQGRGDEKPGKSEGQEENLSEAGSSQGNPVDFNEQGKRLGEKEKQEIWEQIVRMLEEKMEKYSPESAAGDGKMLPSDIKWTGSWETVGVQPGMDADDNAQEQGNIGQIPPMMLREEQKVKDEAFLEAEKELERLPYLMAKRALDRQYEEQLLKDAAALLFQIDFGQRHREVEKRLFRSTEVPESAMELYAAVEFQVKKVMKKLRVLFLPVLEKRQTRMESGLSIGRRLDIGHIYRRDGRVFQKRRYPGEESDVAIALLIDQSASMEFYSRLESAKLAMLCLYLFCKEADIPTAVYGHHTDRLSLDREEVHIHSYAEFDSRDGKDKYRIMGMETCGANRDGMAVRYVGEVLLRRPERKKILVLTSDGLPNASGYSGEAAKKDLRKVKEKLEKQGVIFLAAAIGSDKEQIKDIYGKDYLDISDMMQFPEKLTKEVLKRIG